MCGQVGFDLSSSSSFPPISSYISFLSSSFVWFFRSNALVITFSWLDYLVYIGSFIWLLSTRLPVKNEEFFRLYIVHPSVHGLEFRLLYTQLSHLERLHLFRYMKLCFTLEILVVWTSGMFTKFSLMLGLLYAEVKPKLQIPSPFTVDSLIRSRSVEVKSRKTFVSPLLHDTASQNASKTKVPVEATSTAVTVKRSAYFSRPVSLQSPPTSPGTIQIQRNVELLAKFEDSQRSTSTCTSEGGEIADHREFVNDVVDCPDLDQVFSCNLTCHSVSPKTC